MRIRRVYVRFYKAFNIDYLRKVSSEATPDPWETLDGTWQPFVRVPLEDDLTAVVGANESGKSQLLEAIARACTGSEIERVDFCRYSRFFGVEETEFRYPDFGLELHDLTVDQAGRARALLGLPDGSSIDPLWVFRMNRDTVMCYAGQPQVDIALPAGAADDLTALLPTVIQIAPDIPLPDSVPLSYLRNPERLPRLPRTKRGKLVRVFEENADWFTTAEALQSAAPSVVAAAAGATNGGSSGVPEATGIAESYALARRLLISIGKVAPDVIDELSRAVLDDRREGYVSGLISEVNQSLAKHLNLQRWWTQDRDFQLIVDTYEHDLVFTVRDRTGTEYSFRERSMGLKYFLSYLVQFLSHPSPPEGVDQVLTMDEPDAYLSAQGQQDLLRVFAEFARPTVLERRPVQVVYVTHSPYLIDRNHAERIRTLDKGAGDEGTRVVKDVAKNHYEPLRSAFGPFVAETVFIGSGNLVVEGQADQVLIAGMTVRLRSSGVPLTETIDLNRITLVPAGSAGDIPHVVYLARGRTVDRPAVVVLLDSDEAGNRARKELMRKPTGRGRLLDPRFVAQIGSLTGVETSEGVGQTDTEDLIPVEIAVAAARHYAQTVLGIARSRVEHLTETSVQAELNERLFPAVRTAFEKAYGDEAHIEKVGFARALIDVVGDSQGHGLTEDAISTLDKNFRALFADLSPRIRASERELMRDRLAARVKRVKSNYLADHPAGASRETGRILIEEIQAVLDDSNESADIRAALEKLRREFELDVDLTKAIDNFPRFVEALDRVQYAGVLAAQPSDTDRSVASSTNGGDGDRPDEGSAAAVLIQDKAPVGPDASETNG